MQNSLLLIEDEALLGNELQRFFLSQNWEVTLASSLAEARDVLKRQNLERFLQYLLGLFLLDCLNQLSQLLQQIEK